MTEEPEAPVYVFKTHEAAAAAIALLSKAGFAAADLSLIGKGHQGAGPAAGFATAGDRVETGRTGTFWGSVSSLLFAPVLFFLPGLGLIAMAGPFVSQLAAVLEGTVIVGGVSAVGAALVQFGVPEDQVVKFENALTVDSYVLLVHGDRHAAHRARMVLLEASIPEIG